MDLMNKLEVGQNNNNIEDADKKYRNIYTVNICNTL